MKRHRTLAALASFLVVTTPLRASPLSLKNSSSTDTLECTDTLTAESQPDALLIVAEALPEEAAEGGVDSPALVVEALPDVDTVMRAIRAACPDLAECNLVRVREMIDLKIEKAVADSSTAKTYAGRTVVVLLYGGSVFGLGLLTAYLLDGHYEFVRTALTAFVMLNAESLFGKFSGPFLAPMEAGIGRFAFRLWNPQDRWGKIKQSASETVLYRNTQIMDMLLSLKLKRAGAYVRKGLTASDAKRQRKYMKAAADRLAHAIAHGYEVFVKTNLDSAPLIRELRQELPADWSARRSEFLPELCQKVLERLRAFRAGVEIFPETDRDDLLFFGAAILRIWFQ